MKKQLISALIGLSVLLFGGVANASTVYNYNVQGGFNQDINTLGDTTDTVNLNVGTWDALFTVTLNDTTIDFKSVVYNLYDSAMVLLHTSTLTDINSTPLPAVSWLLLAGQNYVLDITTSSNTSFAQTNLSAVPLPGAALLFGSALFGAGMFGRKNKASKNNDFTAIAA